MTDRLQLRHGKTSYRFGQGAIVYLFFTAGMLGVGIYTQANLIFWAFGLMVAAGFASLVLSAMMMRQLDVQRMLPNHGVAGEEMVIRYRVENRKGWMPVFGLVIEENWGKGASGWKRSGPVAERPAKLKGRPQGWILHLGPAQAAQAEAPCWPLRRGALQFQRITLTTGFPFGILRRVAEFEEKGEVLVYPHLYRINKRVLHRLSEFDMLGRKRLEKPGGHEEFFGLRQYRAGDSLKMVDWKRSAKTGELISREMTQPSPPKIMVVLDLEDIDEIEAQERARQSQRRKGRAEAGGLAAVEQAVSLTASIVCDAYTSGYQVGLAVLGLPWLPFPVHHSLPHRTRMLEALARLDTTLHTSGEPGLPVKPSVIVRPGAGAGVAAPGGQTVLGTDDMDKYVLDIEGGASTVLARRSQRRPNHRARSVEGDVWN